MSFVWVRFNLWSAACTELAFGVKNKDMGRVRITKCNMDMNYDRKRLRKSYT